MLKGLDSMAGEGSTSTAVESTQFQSAWDLNRHGVDASSLMGSDDAWGESSLLEPARRAEDDDAGVQSEEKEGGATSGKENRGGLMVGEETRGVETRGGAQQPGGTPVVGEETRGGAGREEAWGERVVALKSSFFEPSRAGTQVLALPLPHTM